jgi:hypothetical protein
LKKIREAKRAVEARAREKTAAEGGDPKEAKPEEKDQYNFTDPESRIMKGADGFLQGYNAQAVVEPTLQLIVGQAVTDATNDKRQLMPMLEIMEAQSGQRPTEVLAARRRTWSNWMPKRNRSGASLVTSPRSGRNMMTIGNPARAGRCRKMRRGWIG